MLQYIIILYNDVKIISSVTMKIRYDHDTVGYNEVN
jgi:hypothetical protein